MKKKLRQSLPQQVCNQLMSYIEQEKWKYNLPGIRLLCDEFQVSRQTMMFAIQLLEKSGYVSQAVSGKSRTILFHTPGKSQDDSTITIGIITHQPSNYLSSVDQQTINLIQKHLKSKGLNTNEIICKDLLKNLGARNIESLIHQHPAEIYIVVGASPACKRVLKTLGKTIIYLGGEHVPGCIPRVGFSIKEICARAINHLTSLGHQKIVVMLPEIFNRKNKTSTQGEQYVKEIFDSKNIPFSSFNCPRWGKTKSDYFEALDKLFAVTPPTAIILGDANHTPRLISFLLSRGIRYPETVSIIVLDDDPYQKEFIPSVSYIEKSSASLAKLVCSEVRKLLNTNNSSPDLIIAKTKLVIKDSVRDLNQQ